MTAAQPRHAQLDPIILAAAILNIYLDLQTLAGINSEGISRQMEGQWRTDLSHGGIVGCSAT